MMLSQQEFEKKLTDMGFKDTGRLTKAGRAKLWHKPDGEIVVISVYPQCPVYMIDKILEECGLYYLPLYTGGAS